MKQSSQSSVPSPEGAAFRLAQLLARRLAIRLLLCGLGFSAGLAALVAALQWGDGFKVAVAAGVGSAAATVLLAAVSRSWRGEARLALYEFAIAAASNPSAGRRGWDTGLPTIGTDPSH